jgi:hypothetical protein
MRARSNRVKCSFWLGLCLLCACVRHTAAPAPDAGKPAVQKPGPTDAGTHDARARSLGTSQGQGASFPQLQFMPWGDAGGFLPQIAPPSCPIQVGAECDGNEDCSGGRVCCGTFDQTSFSYTRIACEQSCSGTDKFKLCHAGDTCDNGLVCRRSVILPFSFVSVCAPPSQAPSDMTGRNIAHEIQCGAETCPAGKAKCCLTAHFDTSSLSLVAEPAYCAPLADSCMCHHEPSMMTMSGEDAGR